MQSGDLMIRAMDKNRKVRVLLARTTDLAEEARRRQEATPTAAAALGRALTGAVMMGLDLKGEESLTLRIDGGGPAKVIIAVAESDGTVRGYIGDPGVDLPEKRPGKLNVGEAVGIDGFLEVVRDMRIGQPFTGRVPLVSGEIAEDLAYYFTMSEQIPSLVSLGVLIERDRTVRAAGGLIIQAMPGVEGDLLERIESNVISAGPISDLVRNHSLDTILNLVFGDILYDVIDQKEVAFRCRCNLEKVISVVSALEEEDINKALEDQGCLEVCCNFCNEIYCFTDKEIKLLRQEKHESN